METTVLIEFSARHVHVSQPVLEQLFGLTASLHSVRSISQPGQFAAKEEVTVQGPKGTLEHVRVVGPVRAYTQIELAKTDARILGIEPPLRESGQIAATPGVTLTGPVGSVTLDHGVIIQQRHLHLNDADADRLGVQDGQEVRARLPGPRGMVLEHVLVRVSPHFALRLHVDTDEANAAGVTRGEEAVILT